MVAIGRISAAEHARPWPEAGAARPRANGVHAEHVAEMARRWWWNASATRPTPRVCASSPRCARRPAGRACRAAPRRDGARTQAGLARPRGPGEAARWPGTERAAAQALKDHRDDDDLRVAIVLDASPKAVRPAGQRRACAHQRRRLRQALPVSGQGRGGAGHPPRFGDPRRCDIGRGRCDLAIVQWPEADGAFVALDPASGRVRALVGGFDFNASSSTTSPRAGVSRGRASSPSCTRPRWSKA
jgi:penicillin-binding protein 1A